MNTQIAEALEKRELIKVSLLQNTDEVTDEAALEIAQATNSEVVQVIGRVIVLYKAPSKEKYQRLTQQLKLL